MKIVLTGSLGHIGKPLTELLVRAGHQVTVITSTADRVDAITALGAIPAVGTVLDGDFLTRTFAGADLVYTMIPPVSYSDPSLDLMTLVRQLLHNFVQAIKDNGIKRVIHLSSIGAHMPSGNGLLALHYLAETTMKQLPADVQLTFMRPTGFFYNLYGYIPMIKAQGVIAANYGGEDVVSWVAPADIATAIAAEIEHPASENYTVRYVASEEMSCQAVATLLGKAIGMPDLQWIVISDEQMRNGLVQYGMQPAIAAGMVEMYSASHDGILYQDYYRHRPVLGKTKLADFAPAFAAAFQQK